MFVKCLNGKSQVNVIFDTKELYGKVTGTRKIVVYRN